MRTFFQLFKRPMDSSADNLIFPGRTDDPACKVSTSQFKVIDCYPHDAGAFTEGLELHADLLYESTGLCHSSSIRRVEARTGKVLQEEPVQDVCAEEDCRGSNACFAEGLTIFKGRLFQLTLNSHKGFIYDPKDLRALGEFSYQGQGWGLTHNDQFLIMSNGTNLLQFLDPAQNFKVVNRISVRGGPRRMQLNELEYIKGSIFANLYPTDSIVRIDLSDCTVREQIDLRTIRPQEVRSCVTCDLNGIAYDEKSEHLFVTGKQWPLMFEISLTNMP